ncbi:hypothetical protein [Paucilactobacillus kaifaensis]|uniref:hypothetical protein n=1 Tax=Paucilactobacillus kaifaensis TaxID=2559921 RepID=UPI0010FA6088|nr:hypothetical protein [Paucilactobacillus kaifaensis]
MNRQPAYALLSVLIVMTVTTTIELYRYRQYSEQRQIYSKLQNELLCQTMINLKSDKKQINKFNTGVVTRKNSEQVQAKLTNGFVFSANQSPQGS